MDRELLVELWKAGVDAVDPADCVRRRLPPSALTGYRRIVVIAFGKAAAAMTTGFIDVLGRIPDDGMVVIPTGVLAVSPFPVIEAGHPLPDEASVRAGERAMRLAGAAGEADLVVCLISGGGSALLEVPTVTLSELREKTTELLRSGADIAEVNRVRRSFSRIKGGGLARAAARASLLTLILSDVVGDPIDVIASGPTVADPPHPRHTVRVVGSARDAANGVAAASIALGLSAVVATTTLTGEAAVQGRMAVGRGTADADLTVLAGETTVTVRGRGRGGRNQEAALAAAIEIAGGDTRFLAAGTDGIDGPTRAAGAVVDGRTLARGRAAGLDAVAMLADNDSNSYLGSTGDLVVTGSTGTNVGDVWLVANA